MNEIIIILALIILNGILAMSEIALISARRSHLANEVKKGSKSAKVALKLIDDPDKFLSTIQIGITVIGILTGIYSGSVVAGDLSDIFVGWGMSSAYSYTLAQGLIVIVVTYSTLVLGELVPKRIGMSASSKMAIFIARPMYVLSQIASPFVWLLSKSTAVVFHLFGLKTDVEKITEEEIKSMINEGTKDGEVQEVEQDIVERVFILGDLKVSSLMTHKSDIVSLDINMNSSQIRELLQSSLYEVYPVIDKSFDNVKGIVKLKDLILRFDKPDFSLSEVLLPPTYFHENMSVYKALERMKEHRVSQALIFDEFGGCQGIITLKDILEGLVGTIEDNREEPEIIKRQDGKSWLIDGQCLLYDFFGFFGREYHYSNNGNYTTLGGLIIDNLEHTPRTGDVLHWKEFKLEIVDMDGVRIDKILVTIEENKKQK